MSQPIPTWCWYCKQGVPAEAGQCPSCGKPLTDATKVIRCRRCGKFLLKNTERCFQCGEPLQMPPAPPPEPTPQPEPEQFAPTEAPAAEPVPEEAAAAEQGAEAAAEGIEFPEPAAEQQDAAGIQFPEAAPAAGTPETLNMLEQLETGKRGGKAEKDKKPLLLIIVAAVALIAIGVGIFFGVKLIKGKKADAKPKDCADGAHEWVEADCTHPRTCSVCGKTEGEPAGHQFVDNVCTVCGAYERLFYLTDSDCTRDGSDVVFHGSVQNYSGKKIKTIEIKLQLYDEKKELVDTVEGGLVEGKIAPLESAEWEIRYSNPKVKWKYWRAYVADYSPRD